MKKLIIALFLLVSINSFANDSIHTWALLDSETTTHLAKANQTINFDGIAVDFNERFEIEVNQKPHINLANANAQPLSLGIKLKLVETTTY